MFRVHRIAGRAGAQLGQDAALAALLTAVGLLEVLVGPDRDGSRAAAAAAMAGATVPLAFRRAVPLLPVAAIAIALIAEAPLGGFLVGSSVTPLVALVIALYSAGRHVATVGGLAAAAFCVVAVSITRVVVDPAAAPPGQAALTFVAVSLPLLVGRWVRGQTLLRRALGQEAERLVRDRERDARHAAEEERMRIAGDLQAAIAGGLHRVVRQAHDLPDRLRAADHEAAHALLASIAATARDALADVRRALGILRRDGQARRLTPPAPDPLGRATPEPTEQGLTDAARPAVQPDPAADAQPARQRRPLSPRAVDRTLAGAMLVIVAAGLVATVPAGDRWVAAATALPIVAPLLWRRRHPVLAFVAMLCAIAVQSALLDLDVFPVADIAAVVCVTYAIGVYGLRRAALGGLAVAVLGVGVHAAVFYPHGVVAALLGGVAGPWAVGRVIRGNRQLTRQGREETARAERSARARRAPRSLRSGCAWLASCTMRSRTASA